MVSALTLSPSTLTRVVGSSRDEVFEAISRVWIGMKVGQRFTRGDIELFDVDERPTEWEDRLAIPDVNDLDNDEIAFN